MLSPVTRWVLLGALALLAVVIAAVWRGQRRPGRIGGAMAPAKAVWLGFALYTWFIASPALALDAAVSEPLRHLLGAFAIAMWARGPVELFMMYVTKNWRPPYGIAHDALCLAVLLGGAVWLGGGLWPARNLDAWVLAFAGVVAVSLVLEIIYAAAFLRIVGRRTLGDEAVWFASAEEPVFRRVVRWTAVANVPLVVFLAAFLWRVSET